MVRCFIFATFHKNQVITNNTTSFDISRMELTDIMAILQTSFPLLSAKALSVETPFTERRSVIQSFQQGTLQVLVATPGIIGRGLELRQARSVRHGYRLFILWIVVVLVICSIGVRVHSLCRSNWTRRRTRFCMHFL